MFLQFCENYGVPKTGLFQTVDLYEGRNMAQVLNCIQQLGSEVGIKLFIQLPFPLMDTIAVFSLEKLKYCSCLMLVSTKRIQWNSHRTKACREEHSRIF